MILELLLVVPLALALAYAHAEHLIALERGREREEARAEAREMRERLLSAKLAGADIPPPPEPALIPETPLLPDLERAILDWETPAAQDAQRRWIRSQMAAGRSQAEILRALNPVTEP